MAEDSDMRTQGGESQHQAGAVLGRWNWAWSQKHKNTLNEPAFKLVREGGIIKAHLMFIWSPIGYMPSVGMGFGWRVGTPISVNGKNSARASGQF